MCFPTRFSCLLAKLVYWRIFKGFFPLFKYNNLTTPPILCSYPIIRDHDMKRKNPESTLPEEAFTQVTAFLAERFLRWRFLQKNLCKLDQPLGLNPNPGFHDLK